MPQSRQRKIVKARKRPKSLRPTSPVAAQGKNRDLRIVAMVVVGVLAIAVVAYVITRQSVRSNNENLITTASGLQYVDLVEGTGSNPSRGQTLIVNYVGTLENGTEFDSSYKAGRPFEFAIGTGAVIPGWDEGLMSMKVGGKRKLIIPPALGYGARGSPPKIPGNSTLVFEVELLEIK